jgi:hypothetical protein
LLHVEANTKRLTPDLRLSSIRADDGGQVNDCVAIGYRLAAPFTVTDVAVHKFKIRIRPNSKKRLSAVNQPIEYSHFVTRTQQKGSQGRTDISCSAGD